MWLPLRLVLEFLGRSAAWLGVMAALGALAALLVVAAGRGPLRRTPPVLILVGVLGAIGGASLAYRFGWPEPLAIPVWRRSIPLVWSAGGALLAAGATLALTRGRRASSAGAGSDPVAAAEPEDDPGPR